MDPEEGSTKTNGGSESTSGSSGRDFAGELGGSNSPKTASSTASGAMSSVKSFASKNRKPLIGGGAATGIAGLLISGSLFLPVLMIEHIAKNLFAHEAKVLNAEEKKLGNKLAQKANPLSKKALDKITSKGKGFFSEKYRVQPTDVLEGRLSEGGLGLELNPDGSIKSVTENGTKTPINEASVTETAKLGADMTEVLKPWEADFRTQMVPELAAHYRVSFAGIPEKPYADDKSFLADEDQKIRNGATDAEIKATLDEPAPSPTDPKLTPAEQASRDALKEPNAKGNSIIQAALDSYKGNRSVKDAIKAGQDQFTKNKAVGAVGYIAMVCGLNKLAQDTQKIGRAQRAIALIREGSDILAAVGGIHTGHVNLANLGRKVKLFTGDTSAALSDKKGRKVATEESKDFTQAAGWKRAIGIKPNKGNPDINPAAHPDAVNSEAKYLNILNSVVSLPGLKQTCSLTNSKFGFIVVFGGQFVEVAANLLDGEVLEAGITTANIAAQYEIAATLLPPLISGAAGLAITGTEDAVQQINNRDAGLGLATNDHGRAIGALPINNTKHKKLTFEADAAQAKYAQKQGIAYSLVSLDNPQSVLARTLDVTPTTPKATIAMISHAFATLPQVFGNSILGLVRPVKADDQIDTNPYQLQQYGFTTEEIDDYEPIDIINKFESIDANTHTRLEALGDPETIQPGATDPNAGDLLHCFVNPFAGSGVPGALKDPGLDQTDPDSICKSIGLITNTNDTEPNLPSQNDINSIYSNFCNANNIKDKDCFKASADELTQYRLYLGYHAIGKGFYALGSKN